MPQAVVAVAIQVGTFVGTITGSAALAAAVTKVVSYAILIGGPVLASRAFAGKLPKAEGTDLNRGRLLETVSDGKQAGRVVYGQARVGGARVAPPMVSGTNNKYLWLVHVFACHEIESFEKFYVGDYELDVSSDFDGSNDCTDSEFIDSDSNKLLRVIFHDGSQTTSDSDWDGAFTEVTSSHKLQGLAYCVIRLTYDETTTPTVFLGGPPRQFSARIKGKKVYDPRVPTTAWSDNPALCLRDYLTDTDYGLAEPSARIDDDAIETAADICEESVTVPDNAAGSTTQDRWTCNGVLSSGASPVRNLELITASMGGATAFVGSGEWRTWAAAYSTPAHSIDEDYLAGPVKVIPQAPAADRHNVVTGTYIPYDRGGIAIPFPARSDATYETDDGLELPLDLQLPMTDDTQRAQRLAVLALKKSRDWETVELVCNLRAFKIELYDNIQVSIDALSWSSKVFKVIGWKYDGQHILLTLRGESSSAYDLTGTPPSELDDDPAPTTV